MSAGRNSGSMTDAKNSTITSGTPRTNSMKTIADHLISGSSERRASASRIASGNDTAMETHDTTRVTSRPPQSSVDTTGKPSQEEPVSKRNAAIGKMTSI